MKQSPLMYFQMSKDGNWIVSTDLGGMDIKQEQMSVHQDPSTLGLRWKKAGLGLRVVRSNYNTGPCNWYKKSGTTNGAVYLDDTSTTKPICNNIHCGQNEGTQGNIQEDEKAEGTQRNIQEVEKLDANVLSDDNKGRTSVWVWVLLAWVPCYWYSWQHDTPGCEG